MFAYENTDFMDDYKNQRSENLTYEGTTTGPWSATSK